MQLVETAISKAMSLPKLYNFVQRVIAGPMHHKIAEMLKSEVLDKRDYNVLDVGCGIGSYSQLFANVQYTGFDLDQNYIDYANQSFIKPNARFLVGNAVFPPTLDRRFDYIFSVGLYHHLSDNDTVESLRRLYGLLDKGGYLIVFDAVYPRHFNVPGYVLRRMDRGKNVRTFDEYEKLVKLHFKPTCVDYYSAGLLDFIFFKICQTSSIADRL
jgi:SAM-dependent methyltransferase